MIMTLEQEIECAKAVCVAAHSGQFRRDGVTPYHSHPFAVADKVPDELKPAAYLHDVLEDTALTLDDLKKFCSGRTLEAVDALTRLSGESYDGYMSIVVENPDAVIIKIADMEHNLSCEPSENSIKKIGKWLPALKERAKISQKTD